MGLLDKKMTRKEFVKGTAVAIAGLALFDPAKVFAEGMTFSDNIVSTNSSASTGGGAVISDVAPVDTKALWVDTASGGVLKYYDGTSWRATKAVWG